MATLPLNRAYSLLSLSYPLVYLCAALLPGLGGSLSAGKTCGVILVVLGVVLINARQAQRCRLLQESHVVNISVFGVGYVGLVQAAVLAEVGHERRLHRCRRPQDRAIAAGRGEHP